jgi:hypothetical protein
MMGFSPYWPKNLLHGLLDTGVTFEHPEGRSDVPRAIFPPNGEEAVEVPLIEAAAVIGYQIAHHMTALEPIDTQQEPFQINVHLQAPSDGKHPTED